MKVRTCLGFGSLEGKCSRPVAATIDTARSKYWCEECDVARIAHISRAMTELEARLTQPQEVCLAHLEEEPCQTCAAYIAAGL